MKHIDYLEECLEELPEGYVFTHEEFKDIPGSEEAIERYLNSLSKKGTINKLAKDKFYKPLIAVEEDLSLKPYEVVKDFLFKDGKQIGYLTGFSSIAALSFDHTNPTQIELGIAEVRNPLKRGPFKITFIKQDNPIVPAHIPYFRVLDVLRFIHKTTVVTPDEMCFYITQQLTAFTGREHQTLIKLAQAYNARTRALTGALIEKIGYVKPEVLELLKASIAGCTSFTYHITPKNLPNAKNWKIICD